jgi:hypothetical protein
MGDTLESANAHTCVRLIGPLLTGRTVNSCYPSPTDPFRRAKGGDCGEMNIYAR